MQNHEYMYSIAIGLVSLRSYLFFIHILTCILCLLVIWWLNDAK